MAKRVPTLGENVARVAREHGVDAESIAEAADLSVADVHAFLSGERDVTFGQLVQVGGLLRVRLSVLFEGVAA